MSGINLPAATTVIDAAERRRRMGRVYVILVNLARQKRVEAECSSGNQSRSAD